MSMKDDNPFLPEVEVADEVVSVNSISSSISGSSHPLTIFFHFAFKVFAIFLYFFGGIFLRNASVQMVMVVLLNAMDFYMVKNISGRLLVGLRWWSVTSADGLSQTFRFEKTSHPERVSKADSRLFWTGMIISTVVWCFFSLTTLLGLKFRWLIVAGLGAALSGYNLYAYMQAAKDSNTVMSMFSFIPKTVTKKAVETISTAALNVAKSTLMKSQQQVYICLF